MTRTVPGCTVALGVAAPSRTTSTIASKIVSTLCPAEQRRFAPELQKVAEVSPRCSQIVKTSSVQRLLLTCLLRWFFFFAILFSLDRLRSGYFTGVYSAPQASTWSRVRHSSSPGQRLLRSRQHPLGFSELHPEARARTLHSNAKVGSVLLVLGGSSSVLIQRRTWEVMQKLDPRAYGTFLKYAPLTA